MDQHQHYQEYQQDYQEYQQYPSQQEYGYEYQQDFDYEYKDYGLPSEPNVMRTKRVGHRKALSNSYMAQKPTHRRTGSGIEQQQQQPPALVLDPSQSQHRRFHSVSGIQMEYMPQSPMTHPPVMYQQQIPMMNQMYDFRGHQKSMSNEFNMMKMATEKPRGRPLHPLMQDNTTMLSEQFENNTLDFQGFKEPVYFDESKEDEQIITSCSWGKCHLQFQNQDQLVSHIMNDHVGTGKASYVCEWIGCSRMCKPFSKRHKIQNHIRIHTGERPFPCPVADCGKRFSRQDGLNTHVKTHSTVKPYVCQHPNCGKAYFHSRSLRKHERSHLEGSVSNNYEHSRTNTASSNPEWNVLQVMAMQQYQPTQSHQSHQVQPFTPQSSQYPDQGYLMELASLTQGNPQMATVKLENQVMLDSQMQNQMPPSFVMNEQWARS